MTIDRERVTDEMVETAMHAYWDPDPIDNRDRQFMRQALEVTFAALMHENEALRVERDNATSNFMRESRENEALRKQLATWHRHQTGDK